MCLLTLFAKIIFSRTFPNLHYSTCNISIVRTQCAVDPSTVNVHVDGKIANTNGKSGEKEYRAFSTLHSCKSHPASPSSVKEKRTIAELVIK